MAAKKVKGLVLLFYLFPICQPQTAEDIGANFCLSIGGEEDNLSCAGVLPESGQCFNRSLLCNGARNCTSGEDEGGGVFPSLECKF